MPLKRDDIVIRFGGDDSRLQKVTKRVQRTGKDVASTFKKVGTAITSALGVGAGFAAGGATAAIADMTKKLDELGKTAVGLNTTVEELHALRFAVSQTSTATDRQLDTALQRLIKHVGQANRGVKESQKIFTELGLSWEYLASLRSDQVFLEVNEAIAAQKNEFTQASLAQKLYEDNWRVLLPTILTTRDGMKGLVEQSKAMGGPTTEAAEAAADLNDAIGRLNANAQGLAYEYGPAVIGWLNDAVTYFGNLDRGVQAATASMTDINRSIASEGRIKEINEQIGILRDQLRYYETPSGGLFEGAFKLGQELVAPAEEIRKSIAALEAERLKLTEAFVAARKASTGGGAGTPSPDSSATEGKGGKKRGSRPVETTGDALVDNRLERQRKEITQEEYRKRRSEIIRGSDPAGDLAKVPANSSSVTPEEIGQAIGASEIGNNVGEQLQTAAEKFIRTIDEGLTKNRIVKVTPEIVGITGGDAIEDAATEEGERQ